MPQLSPFTTGIFVKHDGCHQFRMSQNHDRNRKRSQPETDSEEQDLSASLAVVNVEPAKKKSKKSKVCRGRDLKKPNHKLVTKRI